MKPMTKQILIAFLMTEPLCLSACSDPCAKYDELSAMGESFELRPDAHEIRDACMTKIYKNLSNKTEWDGTRWLSEQKQWKYGGSMTKLRIEAANNMEKLSYIWNGDGFAYHCAPKGKYTHFGTVQLGNFPSSSLVRIIEMDVIRTGKEDFLVKVAGDYIGKEEVRLTNIDFIVPPWFDKKTLDVMGPVSCQVNGNSSYTVSTKGDRFTCKFSVHGTLTTEMYNRVKSQFKTEDEAVRYVISSTGFTSSKDISKTALNMDWCEDYLKKLRHDIETSSYGTVL